MKETSDLLAEAVGRPGNEDLAPLLAEVQWMERANASMLKFIMEGRNVLLEMQQDMRDSYSPARLAEIKKEAADLLARRQAGLFGTGKSADEILEVAKNGSDEEVSAILDKMLEGFKANGTGA